MRASYRQLSYDREYIMKMREEIKVLATDLAGEIPITMKDFIGI